mmetsp:Transcript_3/g.4  ORF Transcript_3/g.4 Transcript_3/m.4 type:complete len:590 (-) Transcript_3:708-2477(-)
MATRCPSPPSTPRPSSTGIRSQRVTTRGEYALTSHALKVAGETSQSQPTPTFIELLFRAKKAPGPIEEWLLQDKQNHERSTDLGSGYGYPDGSHTARPRAGAESQYLQLSKEQRGKAQAVALDVTSATIVELLSVLAKQYDPTDNSRNEQRKEAALPMVDEDIVRCDELLASLDGFLLYSSSPRSPVPKKQEDSLSALDEKRIQLPSIPSADRPSLVGRPQDNQQPNTEEVLKGPDPQRMWYTANFPAWKAVDRRDARNLQNWLEKTIEARGLDKVQGIERFDELLVVYSICILETVKQVAVSCSERGQVLAELWRGMVLLLRNFMAYAKGNKAQYDAHVAQLRAANASLQERLEGETKRSAELSSCVDGLREQLCQSQKTCKQLQEDFKNADELRHKFEEDLNLWLPQWREYMDAGKLTHRIPAFDPRNCVAFKRNHPEEYKKWRAECRAAASRSSASRAGNRPSTSDGAGDEEEDDEDESRRLLALNELDSLREDIERLMAAINHCVDNDKLHVKRELADVKAAYSGEKRRREDAEEEVERLKKMCMDLRQQVHHLETRGVVSVERGTQTLKETSDVKALAGMPENL